MVHLTKQHIIDLHVVYGGGIPVEDAIVTPSIGIGGKTDQNGNFIYKVIDPVKSRSEYERASSHAQREKYNPARHRNSGHVD